jgi:hypothetical protein
MSWKIGLESRVASAPSVSSHPGNKVLAVKRSILHISRITETTILLSCLAQPGGNLQSASRFLSRSTWREPPEREPLLVSLNLEGTSRARAASCLAQPGGNLQSASHFLSRSTWREPPEREPLLVSLNLEGTSRARAASCLAQPGGNLQSASR